MKSNEAYKRIRRNALVYGCARVLFTVYFSCRYRLNIQGRENIPSKGPIIIVPKHQRWIDIPVIGFAVKAPCHYIAKKELFNTPLIKELMIGLGGISLDRQYPIKSRDSLRYLDYLLRCGEMIVLFPEGTYFPDRLGEGKFRLIEWVLKVEERLKIDDGIQIPFVPIGIHYGKDTLCTKIDVKIGNSLYCRDHSQAQCFTKTIIKAIGELSGLQ